jgi:hypothetical protein
MCKDNNKKNIFPSMDKAITKYVCTGCSIEFDEKLQCTNIFM